jgi:hypothetical protein
MTFPKPMAEPASPVWPPPCPTLTTEPQSGFNSLFSDFDFLLSHTGINPVRRRSLYDLFVEKSQNCCDYLTSLPADRRLTPQTGPFLVDLAALARLCQRVYFAAVYLPKELQKEGFEKASSEIVKRMLMFFAGLNQPIDFNPPVSLATR